jgi:hypothetical protein
MAAAIAAGAISSPSMDAAFPGYAGKITFIRSVGPGDFDIFTMNADGGEQANITNNPLNDPVVAELRSPGRIRPTTIRSTS